MLTDLLYSCAYGATVLATLTVVGNTSARKVGGIWFVRCWRIRVSFCLARATQPQVNYEPRSVYDRYLAG